MGFGCSKPVADVEVTVADKAVVGQAPSMIVSVTNTSDKEAEITRIDLSNSYTEGMGIRGVEPQNERVSQRTKGKALEYYFADLILAPFETRSVTFTMRPKEKGSYSGNVWVCMNEGDCTKAGISTRVKVAP